MIQAITIEERAGLRRSNEYVRVSVPFAKGELQDDSLAAIFDPGGLPRPSQTRALKRWPDGSVKWLLTDFPVSLQAGATVTYGVGISEVSLPPSSSLISIRQGPGSWLVDTGAGTFSIDIRTFRPFAKVVAQDSLQFHAGAGSCTLSLDGTTQLEAVVDTIQVEDSGCLRSIIRITGHFALPNGETVRCACRLHFFAGSLATRIDFTLHNPRRAHHPGGLWDLGDPGSFLFKELAFALPVTCEKGGEVYGITEPSAAPVRLPGTSSLVIYQESSGGENWKSPNHRNLEGTVPLTRQGYVVECNGQERGSGLRATPLVWCGRNTCGLALAMPRFWQEFPTSLEVRAAKIRVALFPGRFPDRHELQGGEQKTHTFFLDFASEPGGLAWALSPVQATVAPAVFHASGIFNDLPGTDDLVDMVSSAGDILKKRERLDEYGWRNFGEVYSDHEAVFHKGEEPFVSHYNNQYDFCAGAYRKSLATGDHAWGELAADLAQHVLDIDLYHTDQDREEYNHGLFWHTDHYLDAGLSSHRAWSKEHLLVKPPQFCGGGPGAEHCYTTGLMLHYFLTGNPDFRQAVIELAEWELRALEGPQTVLAAIKRGFGYVNLLRSCQGEERIFPRYPLTRGTGNALTACLDAFEVSGERRFLAKAEELIQGALHPGDDIAARNLLDAEIAWSYTVLLAAVAKFLDKKAELRELDAGFDYAKASLLAYAEWMLDHEYPYLDKPEILEYPNETWAAQDLRKSVIFYQASRYAGPGRNKAFVRKAQFFYAYARDELRRHDSSGFSRPVALVLQNGWIGERLSRGAGEPADTLAHSGQVCAGPPTPSLTLRAVVSRIVSEVLKALRQTSIRREAAWLKLRIG